MAQRYSNVSRDQIEYAYWLVFDDAGAMRFSRGQPSLNPGERAMSCRTQLPRSLFRVPQLTATIHVAEGEPSAFAIDVEAAGEALAAVVGCAVVMTVNKLGEPT